jgi:4-amino-4-deoxy-L-arabinose transferase-like glycosyltransferase
LTALSGSPSSLPSSAPAASSASSASEHRWLIVVLLVALAIRVVTLGAYPLMDNTEARYAEIARKIVETGDWVMPQFKYGVPFWSKPPLSMWMTAVSYLVLGVSEFSARLPSLLACLPVAWLTYALAARRAGVDAGLRAAVVMVTTPLYFVSAGAVMTDPALMLGTTLSMVGFWQALTRRGTASTVWGYAFFVGLAIGLLAKGPVGVVLTLAPVGAWTLWERRVAEVWRRLPWITGTLLTIALAVPWYVLAERRTPGFLDYFIVGEHWKRYTESGWKGDMFGTAHSRPRGAIWPLALAFTLPWCAIAITFALQAWRRHGTRAVVAPLRPHSSDDGWRAYLWLWMLAPLVFFTFAGNILFTYVLPGLPAFALLTAEAWTAADERVRRGIWLRSAGLIVPLGVVLGIAFVVPRFAIANSHRDLVGEYVRDRSDPAQQLVYLHEAPQSAEFYARGKVVTLAPGTDFDAYVRSHPRDFYALTDGQLRSMPAQRERLATIASFGRYALLRASSPEPVTR